MTRSFLCDPTGRSRTSVSDRAQQVEGHSADEIALLSNGLASEAALHGSDRDLPIRGSQFQS
jgi:hypothetical protein